MKVSPLARRMHTWWPVVLGTTHSKAVIGSCDDLLEGQAPAGGPSSSVAVKMKLPKESPDNFIVPILATAAYRRLNRSSAVEHSMCQPSVRTYIDLEGPDAGRSWAACSRSDAVIHEADAGFIDARGCDMKIGRRGRSDDDDDPHLGAVGSRKVHETTEAATKQLMCRRSKGAMPRQTW